MPLTGSIGVCGNCLLVDYQERCLEALSSFHAALGDPQGSRSTRLNVYPVPDGDTGTNMFLTVASVLEELNGVDPNDETEAVCGAISHGSLMGARGNSGVILSQVLRGMSNRFAQANEIDAEVLAVALGKQALRTAQ